MLILGKNNIWKARKNAGFTQDKLAKKLHVSAAAISQWENGTTLPSTDNLTRLTKILNTTYEYLVGETDDPLPTPTPTAEGSQWIPIRGSIAAGMPIEAIEEAPDPTELDQWEGISADTARRGQHIALRIKGASMEPYIEAGDIAIIRVQPNAESGSIAAVLVNGESATVKRIKFDGGGIWLLPINPLFPPVFYNAEQVEGLPVKIVGVVTEIRRKLSV